MYRKSVVERYNYKHLLNDLTRYRWARKQIYKGWRGPLRGRPAVQLGILNIIVTTLFHLSTCVIMLSPSAAHTPLARRTGGRDAVLCMGSTGDIDGYRHTRLQ